MRSNYFLLLEQMLCKVPVVLAYIMTVYTLASLYYLIMTHDIGTPFKNTLTPEQLRIKKESARIRGYIFSKGVLLSAISMVILQPYAMCVYTS